MNTKIALGVIIVVIIGAVAYFALMQNAPSTTTTTTEQTDQSSGAPGIQGKLDINAICEGALAYMTFPDGDAAAKFVAECKEGKHPDVIDRYRADMNLGDGAQI